MIRIGILFAGEVSPCKTSAKDGAEEKYYAMFCVSQNSRPSFYMDIK